MSGKLKVRTESVISLANEISTVNVQIEEQYKSTLEQLAKMFYSWDGKASEAAKNTFFNIKESFSDARYTVLHNYVRFLKECVGEGYEAVETANIKLADYFKD